VHWFSNKTCDLSVMKSCVFSLFTFQMASQFPKRDNHSAEHVWFFVFYFWSFVITMNHQHILTASSRMLYHGSWVTRSDPSPTLICRLPTCCCAAEVGDIRLEYMFVAETAELDVGPIFLIPPNPTNKWSDQIRPDPKLTWNSWPDPARPLFVRLLVVEKYCDICRVRTNRKYHFSLRKNAKSIFI